MKYAGRKWKKMTQRICINLLLRMLPLGYQIVISNGLLCTALRPLSSTSFHVVHLIVGTVTLNTGTSLDLQQTQPKFERDLVGGGRWGGTCRHPKYSYHKWSIVPPAKPVRFPYEESRLHYHTQQHLDLGLRW